MLSVLISLGHHQAAHDFVEKWKPNLQTQWDAHYSQVHQYGYDASYWAMRCAENGASWIAAWLSALHFLQDNEVWR